jgi:hypothetical protein
MAITALPTPPSRSDPANFADRGDAFLGALPTFTTEANALATDVNTKQGIATTQAGIATTQAGIATAQAVLAQAAADTASITVGAEQWVSGTTYAIGDVVWSPITYSSFRRITAGGGTTDPSLDNANWAELGVSLTAAQELTNKTIRRMITIVSANTNALKSNLHVFTASATLTLPAAPNVGDSIEFRNESATTTPVIARNGKNIMGLAEDLTLNHVNASGVLAYSDATRGWILI